MARKKKNGYQDELNALEEKVWETEDPASRLALLEEGIRLADSHNDIESGYEWRQMLINDAVFVGYPEKMLVAFSWCLAQVDKNPEEYDPTSILWQYKWVVDRLPEFPQISLSQMEDALQDMAKRYEAYGASLRPVYKLRHKIAMAVHDRPAAEKWFHEWRKAAIDSLCDCRACEQNDLVEHLVASGDLVAAKREAQPLFTKKMTCSEIPDLTYSRMLLPLAKLGKLDDADRYQKLGYKCGKDNRDFLSEMGDNILYLVLRGDMAKAKKILEKHLLWALETVALRPRFAFYLAAVVLLEKLAQAGKATHNFQFPRTFPLYQEIGTYDLAALIDWFHRELQDLAQRFDTRNGNDAFRRKVEHRADYLCA